MKNQIKNFSNRGIACFTILLFILLLIEPFFNSVSAKTTKQYLQTISAVNMRSQMTTKSQILMVVPKGQKVELIKHDVGWDRISYKNHVGYIASTYVKSYVKTTKNTKINRTMSKFEKEVWTLTNKERTKRGLKALKVNSTLNYTAYLKSKDMLDKNYIAHNGGTYGSWWKLIERYIGKDYSVIGENLAKNQLTPKEVVRDWMKSPSHRANILNKEFTSLGVGYVKNKKNGKTYWTQHFYGK